MALNEPTYRRCVEFRTPQGILRLIGDCREQDLAPLTMDAAIVRYARYNPIILNKESLARAAATDGTYVTLVVSPDDHIVGFAILEHPGAEERWARVGPQAMVEVAVVEVSRPWRAMGVSKAMLAQIAALPTVEDQIVFMVGYSWTWDLDGTGLAPIDYRTMMIHLFKPFGFAVFQTNEPNVMLRPENLFMARLGSRVSEALRKRFKLTLFNLDL